MTLAAELQAALPRGVVVHVHGPSVFVTAKHSGTCWLGGGIAKSGGLHTIAALAGPVDDVIAVVAIELRHHVERWGPIVAAVVAEA